MPSDHEVEQSFPSATWEWRKVKIARAPQARRSNGASRFRWVGCYPWPRSQKITLVVTWRGGAEAVYLVQSRGRHGVFPGHRYLHDVLSEIMQQSG